MTDAAADVVDVEEPKPEKKRVPLLPDMLDLVQDEMVRLEIADGALRIEFGRQLAERDRWALETYQALHRLLCLMERGRKAHEAVMRATQRGRKVRVVVD